MRLGNYNLNVYSIKRPLFFLIAILSMVAVVSMINVSASISKAHSRFDSKAEIRNVNKPKKDKTSENTGQEERNIVKKNNDKNSAPWWLEPLLIISGITISAWILIWQVGRQFKIGLELQRKNEQEKLKIKIYEFFINKMEKIIDTATRNALKNAEKIPLLFMFKKNKKKVIVLDSLQRKRLYKDFNKFYEEFRDATVDLASYITYYEIVKKGIEIFRIALASHLYNLTKTFEALHIKIFEYLHSSYSEEKKQEKEQDIIGLLPEYMDKIGLIIHCLYDLRNEFQNIFLGKLFNNSVTSREPYSRKDKVIKTDPDSVKKLKRYFYEETEWGKDKQRTEK